MRRRLRGKPYREPAGLQRPQDMPLGRELPGPRQGCARTLEKVGLAAVGRLRALDQRLRAREFALEPRRAAALEEQARRARQQRLGRLDQVERHLEVALAELVPRADRLLLRFVDQAQGELIAGLTRAVEQLVVEFLVSIEAHARALLEPPRLARELGRVLRRRAGASRGGERLAGSSRGLVLERLRVQAPAPRRARAAPAGSATRAPGPAAQARISPVRARYSATASPGCAWTVETRTGEPGRARRPRAATRA